MTGSYPLEESAGPLSQMNEAVNNIDRPAGAATTTREVKSEIKQEIKNEVNVQNNFLA